MDGIEWLFVGIQNKNVTQVLAPFRASDDSGNGGLDNGGGRFGVVSTALTL
jgi:hypothetical protein